MLLFQSSSITTMMLSTTSLLIIFINLLIIFTNKINFTEALSSSSDGKCEVCIGVLNKLIGKLQSEEKSHPQLIEERFREFCLDTKKAENRFCYYIGGLEESATKILGEMSKPLSWGMPAEKICEKLMKKDSQICDLRYEKTIDLKTVDLKKLKVKDLKKILSDWDERCDGCIEKTEFIARVEQLKSKYMQQDQSATKQDL